MRVFAIYSIHILYPDHFEDEDMNDDFINELEAATEMAAGAAIESLRQQFPDLTFEGRF